MAAMEELGSVQLCPARPEAMAEPEAMVARWVTEDLEETEAMGPQGPTATLGVFPVNQAQTVWPEVRVALEEPVVKADRFQVTADSEAMQASVALEDLAEPERLEQMG
jgi:hypothetical protein